jgi:serine protease Do
MNKTQVSRLSRWIIPALALFLVLCSQEKSFLKNIQFSEKNKTVEEDKTALNSALGLQQNLRNIAKSVSPAVVNIRTERTAKQQGPYQEFFDDPFFRRFFGERERQQQRQRQPDQRAQSLGSGIIISEDGYILTNHHVIDGSEKITVVLTDKRNFTARIIGSDEKTDLALIKIDTKGINLPVAPLGDSDQIQVGDFAIAIGNPFGLNWTFTFGVISATARTEAIDPNAPFKNYIQTDVSINPGNSGGPLMNIQGQVVGINSAIFSTSGGSIGIGFAIPINIAKNVVRQLIETGKVERGYLGAYIQDVDEKLSKYYQLDQIEGVVLTQIEKGSPAEKAGLLAGDVVLSVGDQKAQNANHLIAMISNVAPGKSVVLTIQRGSKKMQVSVVIGKREDSLAAAGAGDYWLGMKFGDVQSMRERYSIPERIRGGLVITEVKEDSSAAEVGLSPGDVIDMINNTYIAGLTEFAGFIKENQKKEQFLCRVIRNGRIYFVVLENK